MDPWEQEQLQRRVREWFSDPERVRHYVEEAARGATAAEAEFLTLLPLPPATVLDVGCGAGRHAIPLAERGFDVIGADTSLELVSAALAHARAVGVPARFACVDPRSLPFASGVCDVVVALKVYAFIPGRERRVAWLAELARLVRPHGRLLLTSYFAPSEADALDAFAQDEWHQRAAAEFSSLEALDTFVEGRGFVHWFTREALLSELGESPFVVRAVREDSSRRQVLVCMERPS